MKPAKGKTNPGGTRPDGARASERNYIAALARGISVVRAFGRQPDRLTLAELSKIVELPRATVRRCLLTLTTLGYVESNGEFFRLSPQVLVLAQAYFSSSTLLRVTQSPIEEISDKVGEPCSVSMLVGNEIVYVARSTRRHKVSPRRDVGVNLPAYCTSMGRVLLANLPPEQLDDYFARVTLKKFNHKTVADEAGLRRILDQVRNDDYCIIDSELEYDLRAIAIPLRNVVGNVVAALVVSSDTNRRTIKQLQTEVLPVMRQAASLMRSSLLSLS